jgi:hypothetical protein
MCEKTKTKRVLVVLATCLGVSVLIGGGLYCASAYPQTSNNGPVPTTVTGMLNTTDPAREREVRTLVKKSLRWSMGGIERGAGYAASWHAVDKTFPKLVPTDQPILVQIVRDPNVSEDERLAARMLLSCYGEQVRGYVETLIRDETDPVTRIYWNGVLSYIAMNARAQHVCR